MAHANDLILYQRSGNYVPRIAAVHDLCGYGKCSLGVAIPVLSAAGCDVCSVPTSLFSAHTGFSQFYRYDTTPMLKGYLDAWKIHGVDLDAVYSGFLGSAEQVSAIQRIYNEYPRALRIVDPVMGDGGEKYPTYTDEMCDATRSLVDGADLLVPNLTEASILTGIDYEGQDVSLDYTSRLADALLEMGAKNVVIKGAVRGEKKIYNFVCGCDFEGEELESELLPFMIHGTGDLYASSLLAAIMCNKSVRAAVEFAGQFVVDAMRMTRHQPDFELRGVSFESVLGEITALVGPEFR